MKQRERLSPGNTAKGQRAVRPKTVTVWLTAEGLSFAVPHITLPQGKRKPIDCCAAPQNADGEGRRIFKMTPIHHHFEMSGFSEYKIVITFSLFGLIAGAVGLLLVTL